MSFVEQKWTKEEAHRRRETAVRRYLLFLRNPKELVDEEAKQDAEVRLTGTDDPIEKLKAYSDLERASQPDEVALRAGFVRDAKRWAKDANISAAAFRNLKVPVEVLREAGLMPQPADPKAEPVATSQTRVAKDSVRGYVLNEAPAEFTSPQIAEQTGASFSGINKVIRSLRREGLIEEVGRPVRTGEVRKQGLAPMAYRRVVVVPSNPALAKRFEEASPSDDWEEVDLDALK